jgi:hypothetical protein
MVALIWVESFLLVFSLDLHLLTGLTIKIDFLIALLLHQLITRQIYVSVD